MKGPTGLYGVSILLANVGYHAASSQHCSFYVGFFVKTVIFGFDPLVNSHKIYFRVAEFWQEKLVKQMSQSVSRGDFGVTWCCNIFMC